MSTQPAGFQPPPPAPGPSQTPSASKGSKPATRRALSTTRKLAVVAALLAGLAVLWILLGANSPETYVLRVKEPVAAFTPIPLESLEASGTTASLVEPGSVTGSSPDAVLAAARETVVGQRSPLPLYQGQQVHADRLALERDLSLNRELDPTERLISISANASTAVAGALRPGDVVDIAAIDTQSGVGAWVADAVPVVAVQVPADTLNSYASGQAPTGGEAPTATNERLPTEPLLPGTYVLLVNDALALDLSLLDGVDTVDLYLAYRPANATSGVRSPVTVTDLICASGVC